MNHHIVVDKKTDKFGYFAWPSIAKLPSGLYAMVCSGYRRNHVCPFGKVVISYSKDAVKWTAPAPILDTPLDDRDAGITVFKDNVLITSFNNTREFQRKAVDWYPYTASEKVMIHAFIDGISDFEEQEYLGPIASISYDGGFTFSLPYKIPITAPHGPTVLADESLLMVGTTIESGKMHQKVMSYKSNDGITWHSGIILDVPKTVNGKEVLFCEPHAVQADNGDIIVHIRCQSIKGDFGDEIFTIYQAISHDNGKTYSPFEPLDMQGSPPHLLKMSDGTILCSYGYRKHPFGQRAMVSRDNGKTWIKDLIIRDDGINWDLGYPASIEIEKGKVLTVYYQKHEPNGNAYIGSTIWDLNRIISKEDNL